MVSTVNTNNKVHKKGIASELFSQALWYLCKDNLEDAVHLSLTYTFVTPLTSPSLWIQASIGARYKGKESNSATPFIDLKKEAKMLQINGSCRLLHHMWKEQKMFLEARKA